MRAGGTLAYEIVEFEVKRALEWLEVCVLPSHSFHFSRCAFLLAPFVYDSFLPVLRSFCFLLIAVAELSVAVPSCRATVLSSGGTRPC